MIPIAWGLALLQSLSAIPVGHSGPLSARDDPSFEWTALGDSYASGVGSGDLIEIGQCLRFTQAYPQQMNESPGGGQMPGTPQSRILNNPVCSGAHTSDVIAQQFRDKDGLRNPRYGVSLPLR